MAPVSPHPMRTYEARKASFLQNQAAPGPSRKKAAATARLTWPHPFSKRIIDKSNGNSSDEGNGNDKDEAYPSPISLANLGLYYDPTFNANDRCSVYPDGKDISGWRKGQTALERLEEEDASISWVMIEKSKQQSEVMTANEDGKLIWSRQDESVYPVGKAMNDARWRTYAGAWPLDGKKGWRPTSKKLASAGFHFSPNDDEEDCVSCAYCKCSLGGWEKTDDPVKEHQKRKPSCAMFVSELEKAERRGEASKSRVASSSVTKVKLVSRKRAAEAELVVEDQASSNAKTRPSKSNDAQEEKKVNNTIDEDEGEEQSKPVPKKRKKAAPVKAKQTKVEKAVIEKEEDNKENMSPPPNAKVKKATKKGPMKKDREAKKSDEMKSTGNMDLDAREVEASDFEEEPSRSHSRDSGKDAEAPVNNEVESPPTSPEVETFKTPKQTTSGRPTEKTPKSSSPTLGKVRKTAMTSTAAATSVNAANANIAPPTDTHQKGDIAPLEKLDTLTLHERSMTVEEWLRTHVKKACSDLESEGLRKIAILGEEMKRGRAQTERILKGLEVN